MTATLPDQPITSLDADLLGRGRFVQSLAELISKAPPGSSLRIGVFGGLGEGKTSVLQLMQAILQKEGHVCVWLVPWVTESKEAIAEQLTRQIAQALSINLKALIRWTSAIRKLVRGARSLANLDVRLRVANTVFGDALERLLGKRVERLGEALSQKITDELRGRKLIVFVDDVDRVKSELVPNLLLTLREALDRPDFFYVMALSREIVEQGLKAVHEAWGAPGEFLEKFIEIPRYLPDPSDKDLGNFARALISTASSQVDANALEQLAPLLPRNPRRLKLFVRYLATLAPLVERFSDSELDRRGFYLTQLLQLEFPDEVRRLVTDEKTLKDLQYGRIKDRNSFRRSSVHQSQEQQETPRPEHQYINSLHHPRRAARFLKLCEAIRQRGFTMWGNYTLKEVFALPENPPVFTYQEVASAVDRWKAEPPEERQRHLIELFLTDGVMDTQRCQSFWHRLMEIRDGHLSLVAGEDLEEKVREGLKTASEINRLIEFLAVERGLFRDCVFSVDEWRALRRVFAKWAPFRKLQYYEELRAEERTLLYRVFEQLPSKDQAALYTGFHSFAPHSDLDPGPEFTELALRISRRTAQAAVELVLQRFSESNGAEVFWAAESSDAAKMILFDPNSALYTDQENRETFRRLAERAQTQEEIQLNFLMFFRQLVYGAQQGGSFPSQNCQKILSDHEVLASVWQATVTKPLNPRIAGSLRQYRNAIVDNLASESDMPLPDWWNRLEEAGFFSDDQSQEDKPDEGTV